MSLDPKYARLRNTIFAATLCFALLPLLLVGIIGLKATSGH